MPYFDVTVSKTLRLEAPNIGDAAKFAEDVELDRKELSEHKGQVFGIAVDNVKRVGS